MADAWRWLPDNGSATSRLVREVDWAATSLGPVERWTSGLRQAVAMVLHASYPMFLWWGPELIQLYNDGYVPSFGRGRHPAAMGQRGRECWSEIWDTIGPQIDHVRTTGRPVQFDDALVPITRNGRLEDVFWTYTYTPVFEADGSIGGVLVIVNETTARVLADRRRILVRELVAALATATTASEVFASFTQLLATSDFTRLVAELRAPSHRIASAAAPSPGELSVTVPLVDNSGVVHGELALGINPRRPHDELLHEHAELLGRLFGNALAGFDATAAQESAKSERTNLLLQAPVAAALMVGPELRFELANRGYVELVGREVVGRGWRDAFPELIGGPVDQLVFGAYRTGAPFRAQEQLVELATDDGATEERYFDFNLIPIRKGDHVESLLVIAVELTQQVRARRALEQAGVEREALLADLESANQAKDEFLAMLGHELRNPLAPIVTALDLLDAPNPALVERAKSAITRQVTHLVRLVDDLLDVARLTRGFIELRKAPNDVGLVIGNATEIANELIVERRHQLRVDVQPGLLWIGDGMRLTQVISNLLTNAARYTSPGGEIDIVARRGDGDDLVVSIRDNGKGIEPALLPRIFDTFVQGQRTADRRDGGLGLGLAIARNLVSLHGGTIRATSDGVGKGSEFVVTVPGLVSAKHAPAAEQPATAPRQTRRRILLVDDNADAAQLLGEMLELYGHEVAVVHDGYEAIATFGKFAPDTAILDIGLPGMDGYELVAALRASHPALPCRYFALTGFAQTSDVDRATGAGFDGHLAKPLDMNRLRAILAA